MSPPLAFVGPRSPITEAILEVAARTAGLSVRLVDRVRIRDEVPGDGTWVFDPGLHPLDAGGRRDFTFDLIDQVLPTLGETARAVLLSSTHVFSGERPLSPATDDHAPRSEYGRHLADLEDRVRARGACGLILRLGRVVGAADPLMVRWWNALKEGVAVIPPSQARCAPISVETAATALSAVLNNTGPGVFQVSAPDEVTYLEIAHQMCAAMGLPNNRVADTPTGKPVVGLEECPPHVSMRTSPGLLETAPVRAGAVLRGVLQSLSA